MKNYLFFTLFSLFFISVAAQNEDCHKLKAGTFKSVIVIDGKEFVTMIYRDKEKQIEENESMGLKISFSVKWISGCTYKLSHPKILKGVMEGVSDNQIVIVKIMEVKKENYTAEVSSNFFDGVSIMDFSIIK